MLDFSGLVWVDPGVVSSTSTPSLSSAEIAAFASLVVAVISASSALIAAGYSRNTQQKMQKLTAQLETRKLERNALRDYQYDARRRLYKECEPIIFRFTEECESAFSRIATLARLARTGRLESSSGSWISTDDNQISTLYRIAAPLATFGVLREKLTLFDLKLDQRIHFQYHLGQTMCEVFHHDVKIAKAGKELEYSPDAIPLDHVASPSIYLRQGVSDEDLDALISALVIDTKEGRGLRPYPQFNQMRLQQIDPVNDVVLKLDYLLTDFSPASRPVLWRVLLAQAILCRALTTFSNDSREKPPKEIIRLSDEDRRQLATSDPPSSEDESQIQAAMVFLTDRLRRTEHLRKLMWS